MFGPTPSMSDTCPFCYPASDQIFFRGSRVIGLWDAHPVSPGHALLIPVRHVASWFEADSNEQQELVAAIEEARAAIESHYTPHGYNVGINIGAPAGQTVFHLHVHVIPRYTGDVPDPRGGVRNVIPMRANYLTNGEGAENASGSRPPHRRPLVRGWNDPLLPHLAAHLDGAMGVDLAVAFTLESGVRLVEEYLRDVLERGGQVRILTGDYLGVTEPSALLRLLDLPRARQVRIFETNGTSFHPKGYLLRYPNEEGIAFVGSSNLTGTALETGVEWNYRVVTSRDDAGFLDISSAFEALFHHPSVREVTPDWVARYSARRRPPERVAVDLPDEAPIPIPEPHPVQQEALAALAETRRAGNTAGLVVLATGLGKTWLSAFDTVQSGFRRVLFVAHREEILGQAQRTFRTIRPTARLGLYTGRERDPEAEVLFASIQTLGRQHHLDQFDPAEFDYIVVDEFHHAAAPTYRRLIEYFRPRFLLGLTATPERTDGGDLLALCGENLVYRCDLVEGIRRGLLSPFDYFGVPDEVDYSNIPWKSNRFDEEELTTAVATQARAANALGQFRRRAGERALGFCVSQRHADFMAGYFRDQGLRAVAVHSGQNSAPRAHSLQQLNAGELDILFAVDMFNEGVDLPNVDTVMMLRPTESQILWLQQFGRGLRHREGKRLKVIDYIGNHRTFLLKPRTLFELGPGDAEIARALERLEQGTMELPPECSVTYELEAKDIIRALLRIPLPGEALRAYYVDFKERHGVRPSAGEAYHDGYDPKAVRAAYGSWLEFVKSMGDLTSAQEAALERFSNFLSALEVTPMVRSYKMLVLLAMLALGRFPGPIGINELVGEFARMVQHYRGLRAEVGTALQSPNELRRLIEEQPIRAWTEGRGTGNVSYFSYEEGQFGWRSALPDAHREAFCELVREIAEWRLVSYLRRTGAGNDAEQIVCRVSHSGDRPIIFLPDRSKHPKSLKGGLR